MIMLKYYAVTCKCGHVGKHTYMPITFPIKASDGKEAARVARTFPRVKHDKKDAILDVREIDYEEYSVFFIGTVRFIIITDIEFRLIVQYCYIICAQESDHHFGHRWSVHAARFTPIEH